MELSLFDEVAEVLRGFAPADLGPLHSRPRRWGIKVWCGPASPPREHYEAQVVGAELVPEAAVLALEIGFHVEHPAEGDNDEVLGRLRDRERSWRRSLGRAPVAGPFLGPARLGHWRRLSETWPDPDLGDGELGMEVALRLIDYLTTIEPLRREGTR